jgi:hypothetical protein
MYPEQLELNINDFYIFCQSIPVEILNKPIHYKICLFNTEQLSIKTWYEKCMPDIVKSYLNLGIPVIDYDLYQSTILSNANHTYVPYQYYKKENKYLKNLVHSTAKIYDVAFCSVGKSKRRKDIYNELIKRKIKVIDVKGWKNDRDTQIAQAKILINIHFEDDYQVFEHLRCDRWAFAGQLIISEESESDELLDINKLIIIEKYDSIIDRIKEVLKNYNKYNSTFSAKLKLEKNKLINNRSKKYRDFLNKIH